MLDFARFCQNSRIFVRIRPILLFFVIVCHFLSDLVKFRLFLSVFVKFSNFSSILVRCHFFVTIRRISSFLVRIRHFCQILLFFNRFQNFSSINSAFTRICIVFGGGGRGGGDKPAHSGSYFLNFVTKTNISGIFQTWLGVARYCITFSYRRPTFGSLFSFITSSLAQNF